MPARPGMAGSDDLLARAALRAGIGAWECDLSTEALTWTRGVFELFGIPEDAQVTRPDAVAMYCEDSRDAMERLRAEAIARRRGFSLDARIRRADGAYRWMRLTADIVCSAGRPTHLYGLKRDITDERVRWEALRRLAEHDALTGLVNRAVFQARFLDGELVDSGMVPLGALVLFDIDGFKQINDAGGHAMGDACLETVAERLAAGFPDALMVARIGGDEFAVLCRPCRSRRAIDMQVASVLDRLSAPILRSGEPSSLSASAGIAYAADPFVYDAEAMFVAADAALYVAKRAGRNTLRSADIPG
ncbi:diguanylate cyclase domain-containing protein [Sphingomonas colocasiae]|uniref:Diguanylate cyclase n=1 Tax=Sphingomonas colocasiae TaxID=1848973 RepID=A0ABS7PS45_9SPHN|nr:diguanylate cyclase [Sphingomonas colocasiae]MBY8823804.1 diguanylate cyclase [Sphingomonas colocasiae]